MFCLILTSCFWFFKSCFFSFLCFGGLLFVNVLVLVFFCFCLFYFS
ncbi:hypothetical protein N409_08435 [Helicobacter pylori FD719]|nr:hypothetical protein N409_08435 [Helicobacter pylori FD719]